MRKLVAVATTALLTIVAVLGLTAHPAAADVPNPTYTTVNYGSAKKFTCITPWQSGVFGQYGAWGYYIDGCTVWLGCPSTSFRCTAYEETSIYSAETLPVTQNARLQIINSSGQVLWFRDHSCQGTKTCGNSDSVVLSSNQMASVQCNGVRAPSTTSNPAYNTCSIWMMYENW